MNRILFALINAGYDVSFERDEMKDTIEVRVRPSSQWLGRLDAKAMNATIEKETFGETVNVFLYKIADALGVKV